MLPLDCFCKCGTASLASSHDAFTFTSKILSQASSVQSKTDPTVGLTAAFETTTSILPNSLIAASINAFRSFANETWHFTPITFDKPMLCKEFTAFLTFSSFRLLTTTFAPSDASLWATANPILCLKFEKYLATLRYWSFWFVYPSVEAVTIATLFAKRFSVGIFASHLFRTILNVVCDNNLCWSMNFDIGFTFIDWLANNGFIFNKQLLMITKRRLCIKEHRRMEKVQTLFTFSTNMSYSCIHLSLCWYVSVILYNVCMLKCAWLSHSAYQQFFYISFFFKSIHQWIKMKNHRASKACVQISEWC